MCTEENQARRAKTLRRAITRPMCILKKTNSYQLSSELLSVPLSSDTPEENELRLPEEEEPDEENEPDEDEDEYESEGVSTMNSNRLPRMP